MSDTSKLLQTVIDALSDEGRSITDILLKTKVLLSDLSHPELIEWINKELNGYPKDEPLPPYRVLTARVMGTIACIAWRQANCAIPVLHLSEEHQAAFQTAQMREGLPIIEDMLACSTESKKFARPVEMEFWRFFDEALENGLHVQDVRCEVAHAHVANIPAQVRSRLLDFLLALRSSLGGTSTDEEIRDRARALDLSTAFNGAVFGDNAVISIGIGNKQDVQNTKVMTVERLVTELRSVGVPDGELDALKAAIEADKSETGEPSLAGHTGKWYQNLLAKAKVGAVKVGVGVVTSTVATALIHFIGLSGH